MATDAIIVLNRLSCVKESDGSGHSEPFLWPVLLWIDDRTLQTPELVGVTAPALGNARLIIRNDMRAGQTADIPAAVGRLRVRLEDGQRRRNLILALLLWENDETPVKAIRAGFQAFPRELRAAIAANLAALDGANDEERAVIVRAIEVRVNAAVTAAITGALTTSQKIRVKLKTLNLDDVVGSAFRFFPDLATTTITARIGEGTSNDYEIRGELLAQPVVVDPCQAQVDRVAAARQAVGDINEQIERLQDQLQGQGPPDEPRLPKAEIIKEIKRLREEELPVAAAALAAAQAALQRCRNLQSPVGRLDDLIVVDN